MADDIVTRLHEEIDSLKADVQVLRDAITEIERLRAEVADWRLTVQAQEAVAEALRAVVAEKHAEIERLRDELAAWQATVRAHDALAAERADEIERLRAQVESAHNIIGSETMVWVFHGSEGWLQANLQHLKDPIHLYWETYGNAFKEARRG